MTKDILISGVFGGMVMFAVMAACRLLLPDVGNSGFRTMPDQAPIHAALKERITEPGRYVCPYLRPDDANALFPGYLNEPIFEITYKGYTHATVPGFASAGMFAFLLGPMAAAWLLSQASDRVLATYLGRAGYVASLGLFVAVSADLLRALTDELPLTTVAGMAGVSVIAWTLVGLVLAWRIKPKTARISPPS